MSSNRQEYLANFIYKALEDEERALRDLHIANPCEHPHEQLLSVAVASELAIGYLLRRHALKEKVRLKSEDRSETKGSEAVDFLLADLPGEPMRVALELKTAG